MRLEKKEVAVPQVVLSVFISQLLKDVTPDPNQLDLYRTYWDYWDQLVYLLAGAPRVFYSLT